MKLQLAHFFDSSHQLEDSFDLHTKKCAQLHGHTYKVIIELEAPNERHGMIIDFGKLKETINLLDHRHINDVFAEHNFHVPATAENIALFIKKNISELFEGTHQDSVTVKVAEGYKGDDASNWITA
jgi:6-pyruvoyltetrahydropterin/6-carboxytetrahydropterin synthase